LSLLVAMILWASSFIALKLAFQFYYPMFIIFGRMFAASFVFLYFFGIRGKFFCAGPPEILSWPFSALSC
jgi:drug/metabolite transporter (DMT)-like permease